MNIRLVDVPAVLKTFGLSEIDRRREMLRMIAMIGLTPRETFEEADRSLTRAETYLGRRLPTALDNAPDEAARKAIEESQRRLGELP